jgi:hypothetical protein
MRAILVLPALMILSACAATGADGPAAPSEQAGNCKGDGLDTFVGRKVTSDLGAELLAKSGARSLRWGGPGMAMTMDYRPDRLTVSYDEQMLLTSARCG